MTEPKRDGFYRGRDDVIRKHGRELGPIGIATFDVFAMHADKYGVSYPSASTIANLIGAGRTKVSASIGILIRLNLIREVGIYRRGVKKYQIIASYYKPLPSTCSPHEQVEGATCSPDDTRPVHVANTNHTQQQYPENARDAREPDPLAVASALAARKRPPRKRKPAMSVGGSLRAVTSWDRVPPWFRLDAAGD